MKNTDLVLNFFFLLFILYGIKDFVENKKNSYFLVSGICELQYWTVMLSNPGNISNIVGFVIMILGLVFKCKTNKQKS